MIRALGISFALMRQLLNNLGWGLVTRKTKPWLEAGIFSPNPHSAEREKGLEINLITGSCLCDEASVKIPLIQGSESFWVAEHQPGRRWDSG